MQLDAVEACGIGKSGRVAIIIDHSRYLLGCQRPRHGHRLHPRCVRVHLQSGRDGRRCHGFRVGSLVVRVRDPSHVHQLRNDLSALGMYRIDNCLPCIGLRLRIQARGTAVTLTAGAGVYTLGDDQAGTGALAIVLNHEFRRAVCFRVGSRARHRGHDDAILQLQPAQREGGKQW